VPCPASAFYLFGSKQGVFFTCFEKNQKDGLLGVGVELKSADNSFK
jgi:hypothetical protein